MPPEAVLQAIPNLETLLAANPVRKVEPPAGKRRPSNEEIHDPDEIYWVDCDNVNPKCNRKRIVVTADQQRVLCPKCGRWIEIEN
jgi:hypothetical protein